MPLSKERMRERKRIDRLNVKPKSSAVKPNYLANPNRYLLAHIKAYPDGFNPDGTYKEDYKYDLDPFINPLVRV